MKVEKKLLIIVILFLFLGFYGNAQSQWVSSGTVSYGATLWPSISVVNANVAWIAGGASTPFIFKTTNGGATWVSVPTTGLPSKALMCIWAIDENTAFVGDGGDASGTTGGDAAVSKTTNGGTTWTTIFNTGGSAGFFNGIAFSRKTPSFGFAESDPPGGAGQPYYVQITTNGGVNWTLTNPPGVAGNASAQNSLVCIDNQFYGFGMNTAAQIYRTTNGGTNWGSGILGITGTFTSGFAFNDNKLIGLAATSTSFPTISRTTNGGSTWSPISTGGSGTTTISAIKFIPNSNTCYFVGANTAAARLYKSTNSGANWTAMTAPAGAFNFTFFDFALTGNTVTGFAVSPTGTVIKLTETVTTIHQENTITPSEFKLNQNYPNPFNPTTTINFTIPKSEFVTLKIYNILGKEVSTVVNQRLEAGTYNELFETPSELTSGVYFYKLTAGSFTDTKKMTVLK